MVHAYDSVITSYSIHYTKLYDNNKNACVHEMVHAYNSILNKKMSYWIDNGLAGYLSEQKPTYPLYAYKQVPTFRQINESGLLTPINFEKFSGYEYSYTYIEYLDKQYGWDKVLELIKTENYQKVFEKSEKEIYNEWVNFMRTIINKVRQLHESF